MRKSPQHLNPGFGVTKQWKSDNVKSLVYIISDECYDINVDTDNIISPLSEQDGEYCMDAPSTFHMGESYAIKYHIHDPDTPTYMEAL